MTKNKVLSIYIILIIILVVTLFLQNKNNVLLPEDKDPDVSYTTFISLKSNEENNELIESLYKDNIEKDIENIKEKLSYNNVDEDTINKELENKKFILYIVDFKLNDKEENLNLFTKVEIYAIYTNNYIYIFDTKIVDTIYDDKETDILMLNADVNPLKSIFSIDENATITFLIDYYNKKDNSETKSYKLTYKIDLKNKSVEFLNPNDVTVG